MTGFVPSTGPFWKHFGVILSSKYFSMYVHCFGCYWPRLFMFSVCVLQCFFSVAVNVLQYLLLGWLVFFNIFALFRLVFYMIAHCFN